MLSFTDTQIKNLSKDTLLLPVVIDDPVEGTGLIQQKQNAIDTKSNLLITDQQNQVFTDNAILTQNSYHEELKLLNSDQRTNYTDSDIVSGAQNSAPHYTSSWPNIVPILADSTHGLPTSTYGGQDELELIQLVDGNVDTLINGFNFGVTNETVSNVTNTSFAIISPSTHDLAVGHKFVLDDGTNALLGIIDSINPLELGPNPPPAPETVNFTKLSGVDGLTLTGAISVKNALSFTNAERGHQTTVPPLLTAIESSLESYVTTWLSNINAQIVALNNNGDIEPTRKSNIQARLSSAQAILTTITTWQSVPVIDANGRYTDATLPQFKTDYTQRQSNVPIYASQIASGLGSPVQAGDGSLTGAGFYLDLYDLASVRMSKGGGSLSAYYQADLPITFFDGKIKNANKQLTEYTNTFAISKIVGDTIIGQTIFTLEDATDFNIGDSIKIMDNNSIVYTVNVVDKIGNDVEVDVGILSNLTVGNLARFVRQK